MMHSQKMGVFTPVEIDREVKKLQQAVSFDNRKIQLSVVKGIAERTAQPFERVLKDIEPLLIKIEKE